MATEVETGPHAERPEALDGARRSFDNAILAARFFFMVAPNRAHTHVVYVLQYPGVQLTVANNLRRLRLAKGWTQPQAAEAMHTTRNQYVKLENGTRGLNLDWIEKAASAYDTDPGEIVTDRANLTEVGEAVMHRVKQAILAERQRCALAAAEAVRIAILDCPDG